jgi:hypothetical protein
MPGKPLKSVDPSFRRIPEVNRSRREALLLQKLENRQKQTNMTRIAALLVVIGATLAAAPAVAQFGSVFGEPPRPPADVPSGGFPAQPPPVQYPGQSSTPQQYPSQQYPRPPQGVPPQNAARAPSGIQSQPLPPPAGASLAPAPQTSAPQTSAPQNRAAPAPANPPPPQPPDTTARPEDTVVTETPTQKIENARAVFAGLDKITGRTISFDAAIGETVQFGALQVTARACYTRPPTEATSTDAFVEVDEVTLQGEIKRIYTGWMFALSPGLHAVEHPIYDIWLTDCAQPVGGAIAQSTAPAPPAPATPPPASARKPPPRTPGAPPPNARAPAPVPGTNN